MSRSNLGLGRAARIGRAAATVLALALAPQAARAAAITVLNPSFEGPVQGAGGFTFSVTSWTGNGGAGVFAPVIGTDVHQIPAGTQVAFVGGAHYIYQDLGIVAQAGAAYQLSVAIGTEIDYRGAGWLVQLMAGATVLGSASGTLAQNSNFTTVTVSGTGTGSGDLGVWLAATSGQALFDTVQVTGPATAAVPEPATLALLGVGLFGLGLVGLRRWRG